MKRHVHRVHDASHRSSYVCTFCVFWSNSMCTVIAFSVYNYSSRKVCKSMMCRCSLKSMYVYMYVAVSFKFGTNTIEDRFYVLDHLYIIIILPSQPPLAHSLNPLKALLISSDISFVCVY